MTERYLNGGNWGHDTVIVRLVHFVSLVYFCIGVFRIYLKYLCVKVNSFNSLFTFYDFRGTYIRNTIYPCKNIEAELISLLASHRKACLFNLRELLFVFVKMTQLFSVYMSISSEKGFTWKTLARDDSLILGDSWLLQASGIFSTGVRNAGVLTQDQANGDQAQDKGQTTRAHHDDIFVSAG